MTALRVLHAHSGNIFGGIETALLTLAGAGPHDVEQHFALAFDDTFAAALREAERPVTILGAVRLSRFWTVWRARRRLRRALEDVRPDVVVVHSVWALAAYGRVAKRAGIPLAVWLHAAPTGDRPLDRLARRSPPDILMANSNYTASRAPKLFPDLTPTVVHPPVAPPLTTHRPPLSSLRAELATPDDAVVVVQVGRMEPGKGQQVLLEALPTVPGSWACWFVGGAPRAENAAHLRRLEDRVRRLELTERVRFLGGRRDARDLLGAADLLVHPNLEPESFGIVFVEAMYAGMPVVTSAMGGALEIVTEETGVLIPPGDINELREVLARLLRDADLRRRLGAAGPARARAVAHPERQAARFAAALREALH